MVESTAPTSLGSLSKLHSLREKKKAPAPFRVVAQVPSMDTPRDMAHAFFADQREEGEFFRVSVQAVENFFTTSMLPMYKQESGGHT